jgi:hypothetical protein
LDVDQFFTNPHSLAKTLLFEGISLITNKKISENFNFAAYSLYTYDLSKEKASKKVRFVYLMKGRPGDEGVLKKLGGSYISNSSIIVPAEKDEEMFDILKTWEIRFTRKRIMLID